MSGLYSPAAVKAQARRDLHEAAAVPARYTDASMDGMSEGISVRWHTRNARQGMDAGGFDSGVFEGISRLVFNSEELACAGITLQQGGTVTLDAPMVGKFELDVLLPADGPVNVYWSVIQQ